LAKKIKMAELTLTDESLNRYGTRILSKGVSLANFKKNPVMFYNHDRSRLPIGKWEGIKNTEGKLRATPNFDSGDEFAKEVKRKFEEGYLNAASVGILVTAVSNDPELMLPGQSNPTITKCELMEASIVDVPANANAVKLYYKDVQGEILELSINNFNHFDMNKEHAKALEAKIEGLEAKVENLQTTLAELKTFLVEFKEEKEAITAFKASDIIEVLKQQERKKTDKLLEKLSEHPERTFSDWWLKDNKFLKELKAGFPEKYQELEAK